MPLTSCEIRATWRTIWKHFPFSSFLPRSTLSSSFTLLSPSLKQKHHTLTERHKYVYDCTVSISSSVDLFEKPPRESVCIFDKAFLLETSSACLFERTPEAKEFPSSVWKLSHIHTPYRAPLRCSENYDNCCCLFNASNYLDVFLRAFAFALSTTDLWGWMRLYREHKACRKDLYFNSLFTLDALPKRSITPLVNNFSLL